MKTHTSCWAAFLFILWLPAIVTAQSLNQSITPPARECHTDDGSLVTTVNPPVTVGKVKTTTTCGDNEITYLRVNVHFMLRNVAGDPGNFTECEDGLGNSNFTGYDYARHLTNNFNDAMAKHYDARLYPGSNPPPTLPKRIQVSPKGVYFHRVNAATYAAFNNNLSSQQMSDINAAYGVNVGSEINIYLFERVPSGAIGGQADIWENNIFLYNAWKRYGNVLPNSDGAYDMARVCCHELGHILDLGHSWSAGNPCDGVDIDGNAECCCTLNSPSQNGSPCWGSGGNNLMSSVPVPTSLTPCQLDIVHNALDDMEDWIESCCSDWSITNIVDNDCCPQPLPGIKMITSNCVLPDCDNDISIANVACPPVFDDFGCYQLTGAATTCNQWRIVQVGQMSNLAYNEQFYSNTTLVEDYIPVQGNGMYYLNICVTVCGTDCEDYTECFCLGPFGTNLSEENPKFKAQLDEGGEGLHEISIFPNPMENDLYISYDRTATSRITLFDVLGKQVLATTPDRLVGDKMNLRHLEGGSYSLMFEQKDGSVVIRKFVVSQPVSR